MCMPAALSALVALVFFITLIMEISSAEPFLAARGEACERCALQDSTNFRYMRHSGKAVARSFSLYAECDVIQSVR